MKQSIRAGDYFNAVAHLHAYFDHCFSTQASAQDTAYNHLQSRLNMNSNFYQVALLHLAILHEQFSNYGDAAWVFETSLLS